MGKKKLSSAEVERIVHGLFREHLKKRGMTDVLAAFDTDCPRTENSLKKSSQIAEALGAGGKKLYKQNKGSKKPLDSLLAVLSSHYYKKGKSEEKSSKSKLTEVAKKIEADHPEVPETNSPTIIEPEPPRQIKNFLGESNAQPITVHKTATKPIPGSTGFFEQPALLVERQNSAGGTSYDVAIDGTGLETVPLKKVPLPNTSSVIELEDVQDFGDEMYDFN